LPYLTGFTLALIAYLKSSNQVPAANAINVPIKAFGMAVIPVFMGIMVALKRCRIYP
jgi:hypothetical protein